MKSSAKKISLVQITQRRGALCSLLGKPVRASLVLLLAVAFLSACNAEKRQYEYIRQAHQYAINNDLESAEKVIDHALAINPQNPEALYTLGLILEKKKQFQEAFTSFSSAASLDSTHLRAITKVAEYLLALKNYDEARKRIDSILALQKNHVEALALKAAVLAAQGHDNEAIKQAQQVLVLQPGHIRAITVLTELYAREHPEMALQAISDGLANQTQNEALMLLKARVLATQNHRQEVIEIYKALIANHPEKNLYRVQLINYQLSDPDKNMAERKDTAEKMLRDLLAQQPESQELKKWLLEFLISNRGLKTAKDQLLEFEQDSSLDLTLRDELARHYMQAKEYQQARDLYQGLPEKNANKQRIVNIQNRLVAIDLAEGKLSEAEEKLNAILAVDPANSGALLVRARLFLAANSLDKAINDLQTLLVEEESSFQALSILATAYTRSNAFDKALECYQKLLKLQPENLSVQLGAARSYMATEQLKEALSVLEKARDIHGNNNEVIALLADIYSRQQRWAEAEFNTDILINSEASRAHGLYLKGRVLLRKKDLQAAIDALKKSHQLAPRAETLSVLTSAYIAMGMTEEALEYVEAHSKRHPEQIQAKELLGSLYARSGNSPAAKQALQEVIARQPGNNSAYMTLGRLYLNEGKVTQAEQLYLSGLQQEPENVGLRLMLAELYQQQQQHPQAITEYERILAINPAVTVVKNNLAALLMDHFPLEKNLPRIEELTVGLEATDNPAYLDTAGWAQYQLGNFAMATSLLRTAIKQGGDEAAYHYHLGMSYYREGKPAEARKHLARALSDTTVTFVGREEAEETLRGLR